MALLQKAYLGATPLFRDTTWYESGTAIQSDSGSATVTASASAHTKGAWSPLVTSTSANASLLIIEVSGIGTAATDTAALLDIGTGAASSESAIIGNVAIGGASDIAFYVPFKIPSGTRISARIQSVIGSDTATVGVYVIDAGDYNISPTSVDVIGGDTATSKGISFSGASGTWVVAEASTSRAYRAIVPVLSVHNATVTATSNASYDIGVGSAGNEVVFGRFRNTFNANEQVFNVRPYISLFGRNIPSGSRLAIKHPITSNPDRCGFCLIGIP